MIHASRWWHLFIFFLWMICFKFFPHYNHYQLIFINRSINQLINGGKWEKNLDKFVEWNKKKQKFPLWTRITNIRFVYHHPSVCVCVRPVNESNQIVTFDFWFYFEMKIFFHCFNDKIEFDFILKKNFQLKTQKKSRSN